MTHCPQQRSQHNHHQNHYGRTHWAGVPHQWARDAEHEGTNNSHAGDASRHGHSRIAGGGAPTKHVDTSRSIPLATQRGTSIASPSSPGDNKAHQDDTKIEHMAVALVTASATATAVAVAKFPAAVAKACIFHHHDPGSPQYNNEQYRYHQPCQW